MQIQLQASPHKASLSKLINHSFIVGRHSGRPARRDRRACHVKLTIAVAAAAWLYLTLPLAYSTKRAVSSASSSATATGYSRSFTTLPAKFLQVQRLLKNASCQFVGRFPGYFLAIRQCHREEPKVAPARQLIDCSIGGKGRLDYGKVDMSPR